MPLLSSALPILAVSQSGDMKALAVAREQLRATVTQLQPAEQQAVAAELKKIKESRVKDTTHQAERQRLSPLLNARCGD